MIYRHFTAKYYWELLNLRFDPVVYNFFILTDQPVDHGDGVSGSFWSKMTHYLRPHDPPADVLHFLRLQVLTYLYSVDFYVICNWNQQVLSSVDDTGFHKICTLRLYVQLHGK